MNAQVNDDNEGLSGSEEETDYINDSLSDYSDASDTSSDIDPQIQILEDLQSQLNSLTLEAETALSHQSRHTQFVLCGETKRLFTDYEQYGSMARLKSGIEKFLLSGDEKGRIHVTDETRPENNPHALALKKKRPAHYGAAFLHNGTSEDDENKFDPHTDFVTPFVRDPFNPDPHAFISHPLRVIDVDSIPYVTTLPWDPIATILSWPAHLRWPRGLLSSFNKILSIVDAEAQNRLFHHITKWGPSPVFRVGIAQRLKAEYGSIFQTAEEHYLGLTPETRSFLRNIYFEKPYLNIAERRLLALACRIDVDSVQIFWEDMTKSLKGYHAMRVFMAMREIEKNKEYTKKMTEEKQKKTRDAVFRASAAQFNAMSSSAGTDQNNLAHYQVDGRAQA